MAYSTDVEAARLLATQAHSGQTDKAGLPYITHPERVAGRLEDPAAQVVGWLHDTVEDTTLTLAEIEVQFGPETATAVDSPEFKAAALAMMEEKGAVATIKELGISSYTLYDWKKKAEGEKKYPVRQGPLTGKRRKRYSPEFKAAVIFFYQENGAGATLRKFGIVNNSLYNWLNEAGIERVGNLRTSDHSDVIALYREKGADAVMEAYDITKGTLHGWLKEAGIRLTSPKYSPEFKAAAIAMTAERPLTSVAKELGIPASTLATWKMNAKKS